MIRALVLLVAIALTCNASISPSSTITVQNGGEFTVFLVPDPGFGDLLKCNIHQQGSPNSFNLNWSHNNSFVTVNSEVISPYPGDKCGAQVRNVSQLSKGKWQLIAIDDNLVRYSEELEIEVSEPVANPKVVEFSGEPGELVLITCTEELKEPQPPSSDEFDSDGNRRYHHHYGYEPRPIRYKYNFNFCEIEDMQTGQKYQKCHKTVRYPNVGQSHEYVCRHLVQGSVKIFETMITIRGAVSTTEAEIIEAGKSMVLSCKTGQQDLPYCVALHVKTNTYVNIYDNLLDSRYSSHKTKLSEGICQLEIPLPILANETGVWKLVTWSRDHNNEDSASEAVQTGCTLQLKSDAKEEIRSLQDQSNLVKRIDSFEDTISVQCEAAPYKLNYCYLRTPDNSLLYPDKNLFKATSSIGICRFDHVVLRDRNDNRVSNNGLYKCGYNGPTEKDPDNIQSIEIYYHDRLNIEVEQKNVLANENGTVTLMCRTVSRDPVKSCTFISASGRIFNVPNSKFETSKYRYHGEGLEVGDCGITISGQENPSDFEEWTCNVVMLSSPNQFVNKITVVGRKEMLSTTTTRSSEENEYD